MSTELHTNITYMGLSLPSPFVAASSSVTSTIEGIVACAEAGAGAVVVKSLFEEQIMAQTEYEMDNTEDTLYLPEAADYVANYTKENAIGDYLKLIKDAKKRVSIPVIASIHCVSAQHWTRFAKEVELAGADAIELNVYLPAYDKSHKAGDVEDRYLQIIKEVKCHTGLPIAIKVGYYFTNIFKTLTKIGNKVEGMVLFNRFLHPDIDIESMAITSASPLSSPREATRALRWVGILSPEVRCDLTAATGIYDAEGAIKQLLAGATTVQVASALLKHGPTQLASMNQGLREWMAQKGFTSIDAFRGRCNAKESKMGAAYERVQYMQLNFGPKESA